VSAKGASARAYDAVIVGGGLAGQLCLHALAARASRLRVALVERAPTLGGNQTWCCHASDLGESAAENLWFWPLVEARWPGYHVSFPGFERTLDGDYLCLSSSSLGLASDRVLASRGWAFFGGETVEDVAERQVRLSSGTTLSAAVVLDARGGALAAYDGRAGYQKFVGWELEVEDRGALPSLPLLMDATVDQLDGYRFVYVLPFSPTRFLVEDTYFSRGKDLNLAALRLRLGDYLRARGVSRYTLVREEAGVLPMPWAKSPETRDGLAIGYRGGFFHPGTGYSLPRALLVADALACTAATVPAAKLAQAAKQTLRALRRAFATDDRFARLLNRLAFRFVPPARLRDRVFARVYGLPAPMLARFYAGRTLLRDRIALATAPSGLRLFRQPTAQSPLLGETP
jgi:lycopene beta-cyclase